MLGSSKEVDITRIANCKNRTIDLSITPSSVPWVNVVKTIDNARDSPRRFGSLGQLGLIFTAPRLGAGDHPITYT